MTLTGSRPYTCLKRQKKKTRLRYGSSRDFFDHLSEGITGLVNIFRPGAVIIGGGLAEAGDALFIPVNERVSRMTYGSSYIPAPPVLKASGGIYTGAVGAALLQEA